MMHHVAPFRISGKCRPEDLSALRRTGRGGGVNSSEVAFQRGRSCPLRGRYFVHMETILIKWTLLDPTRLSVLPSTATC